MLAETRAELDDFHHASKELEAELESELQRTEKTQQELKVKVSRAETERDEWKVRSHRAVPHITSNGTVSCSSPNLCLCKRTTILQRHPFNANSINYGKSFNTSKSSCGILRWAMMTWNGPSEQSHQAWPTWSPSTLAHSRRKFFLSTNFSRKRTLRKNPSDSKMS